MATLPYVLDLTAFRLQYPEFKDPAAYPDAVLQGYFDTGTGIIANSSYGWLSDAARINCLTGLTAHIAKLFSTVAAGGTPGYVTQATIDKVSVSLKPPPDASQLSWWLNQTPYGQLIATILKVNSAGGWYVGGGAPRAGFRGGGGAGVLGAPFLPWR